MTQIKITIALLLLVTATVCFGQANRYTISQPTGLKETGVNKVLCLKNGNTMLFHFESSKDIIVKVFDSMHQEIASQNVSCRLLDLAILKDANFKGLFEIGGEAVLFMEQEHLSKYGMIRLRINGNNGKLTDEKLMGESAGQSKRTRFYVVNDKQSDGYAVFFCTDIPLFQDCKMNVAYYNSKHELVKDVPLTVDRKNYDLLEYVSAEWQPEGVCVAVCLKKQLMNATVHSAANSGTSTAATYSHDVVAFFIADGATTAKSKKVELGPDGYPYYAHFTFNGFARTVNLLLLSYLEYYYKFGNDIQPGAQKTSILFTFDEETMALKYKVIKNEKANLAYKQQTDSTRVFDGLPVKLFTNGNGLSTAVYRSYAQHTSVGGTANNANSFDSYLGNLCITQFDDDGNEIWGTVLPGAQFFRSYRHFYYADELAKGWQNQVMFGDMPPQVYVRQFLSQNVYSRDKNLFIVYNDVEQNFGNMVPGKSDTTYNFGITNTYYYKLDRKREVTRHRLFGEATEEYKSSFIEGADFDEKRGVYAALVQYKKGDDVSLRMGWSYLD